jgi:hypothetical protein
MKTKPILAWAIETVTFVFAMFGGFFTAIAPPSEADSRFAVGISSFLMLILLLFISVFAQGRLKKKHKKVWLIVAAAMFVTAGASAFVYKWNVDRLTFGFPPENPETIHVAGTQFTEDADAYLATHPGVTTSQLVAKFEGVENRELVWTPDSLRKARMILTANYVLLVLTLSGTIFCLTEGLLAQRPTNTKSQKSSKADGPKS